jgi:hypothetical protein
MEIKVRKAEKPGDFGKRVGFRKNHDGIIPRTKGNSMPIPDGLRADPFQGSHVFPTFSVGKGCRRKKFD